MTIPMIVVGTNPDRTAYLNRFMRTVPDRYRKYVAPIATWDMELGAIKEAALRFERFAFLQDTMEIHRWPLFLDAISRHRSAYIIPRPSCYAMVYDSSIVRRILSEDDLPGQDKEKAITGEVVFCDRYEDLAKRNFIDGRLPILYPEMTDAEALSSHRFYYLNAELGEPEPWKPRLHLRSADGAFSKMKGVYR